MKTTQQRTIWQKTLLSTATSVALASAGVMGLATTAHAQDSFKVGFVTFLSGGASGPFGVPASQGAKLVVEAINEGTLPAPTTRWASTACNLKWLKWTKPAAPPSR